MYVNNSYGAQPVYNSSPAYGAQPVTYNPTNPTYSQDRFQTTQRQQTGGGLFGGQKREIVNRSSVMMGLSGAGIGFMIGGPMGALIGGAIGLGLSIIMNLIKIFSQNKQQKATNVVPAQQQSFYPQTQQPMNNANQQYYMQQQQQMYQQQQQQMNQQPRYY